jgi:hypothetical protein
MGRVEPARAELTAAMELYGAMEMTLWIAQARAVRIRGETPAQLSSS